MLSDTPDSSEPTPPDTPSGQTETPLRGSWRDKRATAAAFGISEKTVERHVKRGIIQQRDLSGNRVQFWVPAELLSGQSTDSDSDELATQNESDHMLAIGGSIGLAAIDALAQLLRESRQENTELSRQLGQALAKIERLEAQPAVLSESTDRPDARPWWRRMFRMEA